MGHPFVLSPPVVNSGVCQSQTGRSRCKDSKPWLTRKPRRREVGEEHGARSLEQGVFISGAANGITDAPMGAMQMPRKPDAPLLSLFAANLPWVFGIFQTTRRWPRRGAKIVQRGGRDLLCAYKRGGGFFGRRGFSRKKVSNLGSRERREGAKLGDRSWEIGDRRSEIGDRRSEIGDRRSEIGDRRSEIGAG